MVHFTSNTYTLKRKIINFSNKISKRLLKPETKFTADITYGMLASGGAYLSASASGTAILQHSRNSRLVLGVNLFILNLHFAETQVSPYCNSHFY